MSRIESVTYHLSDAWPEQNRVQVVADPYSRFKLKELANGTVIVRAELTFNDQSPTLFLNRFIDLRATGPRI